MSLEPDAGVRPKFGVVVSLVELEDGSTRIVLDDVRSEERNSKTSWKFDSFFTHKRLDSKALDEMALPANEYQGLGEAVLARLLALNGHERR